MSRQLDSLNAQIEVACYNDISSHTKNLSENV